ncbi:MAG: lytic transglycosylase, partial [Caulobacteraceae bacterium]|nr:lytic transglycosylase [Caulobacteraceae bacterium]
MRLKSAIAALFAVSLMAAPAAALAKTAPRAPVKKATVNKAASSAETAYYSGDVQKALNLAPRQGARWVAGLAAYRLNKFSDAEKYFKAVSADPKETADVRAASAFWAARSAAMLHNANGAESMLATAAKWPTTFYGMIAARHLDLTAAPAPSAPKADEHYFTFLTGGPTASIDSGESPGLLSQAMDKISAGLSALPVPELSPAGGFTIYKALVYALVKQESAYNQYAVSSAGAMGLMQLMPAAARQAAGDDGLSMLSLFDGPTNMRLGQDYFAWLVNSGLQTYDMLCAVAAYNGGPATVKKVATYVGGYGDSLMIMESMPARETRDYVERVMVNYWSFQHQFGAPTPSLDALAGGASQID